MAGTKPRLIFTAHGKTSLQERRIDVRWVESTVARPDWTAPDPHPDRIRAFKSIPEHENRILRVVSAQTAEEIRVITVFFDRDAEKP